MKKIVALLVVVVVVIAGVVMVPRLVHTCDSCDELYFGPTYQPGFVTELMDDEIEEVCADCCEEQHEVELSELGGKNLEDYQNPIF